MTKSKNKWGFLAPTREEADKMEKKYGVHFTPLIDYMKVIFPDIDDWAYAKNDHYELVLVSNIGKKIISITDSFVDKPYPCSKIKLSDLQDYDFYRSVNYHYAQLTNTVVKHIFGVDVKEPLFDENIPTLTRPWARIGYDLKTKSIVKEIYAGDEKQYQVNLDAYYAQCHNVGISKIIVEKLFDLYDYEIDLNASDNISILIGPNGCGKTTILRIIQFMLTGSIKDIMDIREIPFKSVTCILSSGKKIKMERSNEDNQDFIFFIDDKRIEDLTDFGNELHKQNCYLPIRFIGVERINQDIQGDFCGRCKRIETIIREKLKYIEDLVRIAEEPEYSLLNRNRDERQKKWHLEKRKEYEQIDKRIFEVSLLEKEIKRLSERAEEYEQIDIGSSGILKRCVRRMEDRIERYKNHNINQKELPSIFLDLIRTTSDAIEDLYKKITLLKEIINDRFKITKKQLQFCYNHEREWAYRYHLRVSISSHRRQSPQKEAGVIYFTIGEGENKKEIPLRVLSSGELNDLNMFYDLIFGRPNCIVLIDEPEISLHIDWQERYIDDLIEICEMNNIQALVATHSPCIINEHTDLLAKWDVKK